MDISTEPELSAILDICLEALAQGKSVSSCLEKYPDYAADLRPLLEAAVLLQRMQAPAPRREAVELGQARMLAVLDASSPARGGESRLSAFILPLPALCLRLFMVLPAPLRAAAAVVTVAVVMMATSLIRLPLGQLPAHVAPADAMLADVRGAVEARLAGGELWTPVAAGHALHPGDAVRTLADGSARLVFSDGNDTEMLPETLLELRQLPGDSPDGPRGAVLYQSYGEAGHSVHAQALSPGRTLGFSLGVRPVLAHDEAPVPDQAPVPDKAPVPHFEVHTPALTAVSTEGVFTLRVDEDGATELRVESGRTVAHFGALTRTLSAGEELSVPGTPPAPEALESERSEPVTPDPSPPPDSEASGISDVKRPPDAEGTLVPDRRRTGTPAPSFTPDAAPASTLPAAGETRVPPVPEVMPTATPSTSEPGGLPPGLDRRDELPPGLDDMDELPPGLEERKDKDKDK